VSDRSYNVFMPKDELLEKYSEIVADPRFLSVFSSTKPERISFRAVEGTEERARALIEKNVAASISGVLHIAVQMGLYGLEEVFGSDEEE
jgi:hypothetical protein